MKKLYTLFIALLVSGGVMAQGCLPEGIEFSTQVQIDNFQSNYPNCTEIEGDVTIGVNYWRSDITNLNGLSVLTAIGGSLIIGGQDPYYGNPDLISLSGLDNVTSIGEDLGIYNNDALTSLIELGNMTSIGGWLSILDNDLLTNLIGLDNVTSLGGGIQISGEVALTSLTGLESLTSIGEGLHISVNPALTSLSALQNVTSIGGQLVINSNNALTSLTGLDNIVAGSITNLYIYENNTLSTCKVQSICDYLVSPSGTIDIHDNATVCNSQEEVEEDCTSGIDDISNLNNHLTIYPNPSSTQITVELPQKPQKNTLLTIYNLNGQQLITRPITEPQTVVDISGLPQGVYFVKVRDDEEVMMGKVIKQ